jgi:DNA-directed RNA polymerase beta' subunit
MGTHIPKEIVENIEMAQTKHLRDELSKIQISRERYTQFKETVIEKYHTCRIAPGECVGIIGAQSIGERQTQTTLNTFHTAGKLQQSGAGRLEELLNMTKKLKVKTCTIFFHQKYKTSEDLRSAVGSTITGVTFSSIVLKQVIRGSTVVEYDFDVKKMFECRINSFKIAKVIKEELYELFDIECNIKPTGLIILLDKNLDLSEFLNSVNKINVCGMKGVNACHLDHDGTEWFVVTEGSNLKKMLAHPLIDNRRLYCNDVWEVYECLGIAAVRQMLLTDLRQMLQRLRADSQN